MERRIAVAIARSWLVRSDAFEKRLKQNLFPLGTAFTGIDDNTHAYLKFRQSDRRLIVEETSVLTIKGESFLRSAALCAQALHTPAQSPYLILFLEGSPSTLRCTVADASDDLFQAMSTLDPPLRPEAYSLPPLSITGVDAEHIYDAMSDLLSGGDAELFGTNAKQFLNAPHIIVPLFAHVLSLSSKESIDFPLLLRTIAEQLRTLLMDGAGGPLQIKKIKRDHRSLWHDVLGDRIAFADGGSARISGVPSAEPLAFRVGVYSVVPGDVDVTTREDWSLSPYVLGDLTREVEGGNGEPPDPKRLQEAARYVLEPLTALRYVESRKDVAFLFVHGPLVNQFTQYDESEPSFLPCLDPHFLRTHGITEQATLASLTGVPKTPTGASLWNQFMAVYGVLMKQLFASPVPIVGVVERTAGQWLTRAVLDTLVEQHRMTVAHARKIQLLVERYQISDDFLFGCILEEGEYLEPVMIFKNPERRARERWHEVVRQYPNPFATVLKTSSDRFPFRLELNPAALAAVTKGIRLLYHTSRLLPKYAFPVGLDIVDKYAKVPDWLSRGISARLAADVVRRALQTGDPNIVAQVRQFLSHTPRDFFYRPQP
jgi:hypothetical protein